MIVTRFMKTEDAPNIRSYVESNESATIYHTLDWKEIIESTYRYALRVIVCMIDNRVAGVLPLAQFRNYRGQKKIVGLPFSHFVQPLYSSIEALNALLSFAETTAQKRNAGYLEIKSNIGGRRNWHTISTYMLSELNLNRNIKDIHKSLKPSVRRNIKKAKAYGVSVRIENNRCAFNNFYDLMIETRHRQGSPPYARLFFENLFKYLSPSKRKLFIAYHGTQPIAGIIMLVHGKRTIYAYGASRSDKNLLQLRPNDLLFWKSIEDAHHSGFDVYDFGITHIDHSSLLRFKSQWGPVNHKLFYSYYLCRSKTIPRINRSGTFGRISSTVLRRLPVPVFKIAGPMLLRFLG